MQNTQELQFINSITKPYFYFLKQYAPYFPGCCTDAALLLQVFLKEYFNSSWTLMQGDKRLFPNGKKFHVWLQKDNIIIDTTLFQFYIGKYKFKATSPEEAYDYCIRELQHNSILFSADYYLPIFQNIKCADVDYFRGYYWSPFWQIPIGKTLPVEQAFENYLRACIPCIRKNK